MLYVQKILIENLIQLWAQHKQTVTTLKFYFYSKNIYKKNYSDF